ncbi:MAG: DUF2752 domain-containing protein [Acidobacteria bacterium]|nr:DUF2752 domain-containing protein [Acidobacteriota bacterium]
MYKFNSSFFNKNKLPWAVFIFFGAILIISYFYQAEPNPKVSLCIFYNLTNLPCPGCGLTRSFCSFAKGDLLASFHFHWLGPIMFLTTFFVWLASLLTVFGITKPFEFFKLLSTNELFIKTAILALGICWLIRLSFIFFLKT